jgi:urease gamma subunit
MTKEEHQLEELITAIQQVADISQKKGIIISKREVMALIDAAIDKDAHALDIVDMIIEWAGN